MNKKVLIFTYLQRHLRKLLPVIKRLRERPELEVVVVIMTNEEREIARTHQLPFHMLDEYTAQPREHDFDLGWGVEPLINAIDQIRPDLFLAVEVNYILRNAVRYCSQVGIPNLIIQHGTPNNHSLHAFLPFEGDCFAAWGEYSRDFLVERGLDPDRVVLTGGLHFDETLRMAGNKQGLAGSLGADPDKKWLLFTTQGTGAGGTPTVQEIFEGVSEVARHVMHYDEVELIFQVHPGQTIEEIKRIVETVPNPRARVVKYEHTEALIAASDYMITFFSTTALDAVVLNKPLMLINLSEDRDFLPFVPMRAAIGAYTKQEISQVLSKLIEQSVGLTTGTTEAAEFVNYKNDGKALARIMDLCLERLGLTESGGL